MYSIQIRENAAHGKFNFWSFLYSAYFQRYFPRGALTNTIFEKFWKTPGKSSVVDTPLGKFVWRQILHWVSFWEFLKQVFCRTPMIAASVFSKAYLDNSFCIPARKIMIAPRFVNVGWQNFFLVLSIHLFFQKKTRLTIKRIQVAKATVDYELFTSKIIHSRNIP